LDFLRVQVLQALGHALDRCILDLRFVVVQEGSESLDQVAICDFLAESVCQFGEILGKSESHFPGFVLTCGYQSAQSVHLIFLLGQIFSHWNEAFETKYSDLILLIL